MSDATASTGTPAVKHHADCDEWVMHSIRTAVEVTQGKSLYRAECPIGDYRSTTLAGSEATARSIGNREHDLGTVPCEGRCASWD